MPRAEFTRSSCVSTRSPRFVFAVPVTLQRFARLVRASRTVRIVHAHAPACMCARDRRVQDLRVSSGSKTFQCLSARVARNMNPSRRQ